MDHEQNLALNKACWDLLISSAVPDKYTPSRLTFQALQQQNCYNNGTGY